MRSHHLRVRMRATPGLDDEAAELDALEEVALQARRSAAAAASARTFAACLLAALADAARTATQAREAADTLPAQVAALAADVATARERTAREADGAALRSLSLCSLLLSRTPRAHATSRRAAGAARRAAGAAATLDGGEAFCALYAERLGMRFATDTGTRAENLCSLSADVECCDSAGRVGRGVSQHRRGGAGRGVSLHAAGGRHLRTCVGAGVTMHTRERYFAC